MLPNKRPRLDGGGGGEDDELSLPVATLLARWWRQKQREAETWMDDELAPLLPQRSASRFGGTTDFSSSTDFSGDGGASSSDGSSRSGRAAITPSVNPHTTLLRLGRTAAAQRYLRSLAERYRAALQRGPARDAQQHDQHRAGLAACLRWLGDAQGAVESLAAIGSPTDGQRLLLELARRQHEADSARASALTAALPPPAADWVSLHTPAAPGADLDSQRV